MPTTPSQTQRDTSRVDGRGIVVAAIAVLLLIVMATAMVRLLSLRAGTTTQATLSSRVHAPPLSNSAAVQLLHRYQAAQAARLNSYGWEDAAHHFAHIPIARAMQLLAAHPQLGEPATPVEPASVGKPAPVDVPRPPDEAAPIAPPPVATPRLPPP